MLDSGKCNNKTQSSCFSFTVFAPNAGIVCIPPPTKKGSRPQSLSVGYLRAC